MNLKNNWLGLAEYSTKYRVSISTLRRRIKRDAIRYQLMEGKYYIIDEPMDTLRIQGPSQDDTIEQYIEHLADDQEDIGTSTMSSAPAPVAPTHVGPHVKPEPPSDATSLLVAELKKAYMQVLQEKEQHILIFKEEISDLRTLVGVLETENKRLQEKCNFLFESSSLRSAEEEE